MRGENVALIFGLKLRHLRDTKGYGLKELSEKVGLSASYLNEIEKGKKYPKTDKILHLAEALEVTYDDLVSLKLGPPYSALESLLESPILQAMPLSLLGLAPRDVIDLITRAPREVGAFVHTLADMARSYDMHVEHFFHAMLRSYQATHDNQFPDIEEAAAGLRRELGWEQRDAIGYADLVSVLRERFGVEVDEQGLAAFPELTGLRSVWIEAPPERLLLNPRLSERQKAFQVGREIGYRVLELQARGVASSRAEPASFEQVLNDFKASYFAGAMLIGQDLLTEEMRALFRSERWSPDSFLAAMHRFQVTPEMFLYRLTQILPRRFHLRHYHFVRMHHDPAADGFQLTKLFNMSGLLIPAGIDANEHQCRRWLATTILKTLRERLARGEREAPIAAVQRARYIHNGETYFLLSLARPLALAPGALTSVTLGFLADRTFQRTVRFWNDPEIPEQVVELSCERCALEPQQCQERAAPPVLFQQDEARAERARALERLLRERPPLRPS